MLCLPEHVMSSSSPASREGVKDVGILAMEWYTPGSFVEQSDLEVSDGCVGKYVTGLGQNQMGFVDDREDIGSVLLTALSRLMEGYGIDASEVGRLEVGTETLIDKSKSIKTTLLGLVGNDCEGVTSVNACYGGTAALFNSVAWVESSSWDGRYAIVVCGDIAVYEPGPARPSGGCGAVAMLVGPDAPLVLEARRTTWSMDVWDFYKPKHSEYAMVNGRLSQAAYLESVERCWSKLGSARADFDYYCFHAPYNKLVQKGVARIALAETPRDEWPENWRDVGFGHEKYSESLASKDLDSFARKQLSEEDEKKLSPSTLIPKHVGNTYTASVFCGLVSVLHNEAERLETGGKRILLFSYGSGSVASIYSLRTRDVAESRFTIAKIAQRIQVESRLADRTRRTVEEFTKACELREQAYGKAPYKPAGSFPLEPNAYHLDSIDEYFVRRYKKQQQQ